MATKKLSDIQLATKTWDRYHSSMQRGHRQYQIDARENENFYLGRGLQWKAEDTATLEAAGRPWLEENIIFSTVNTVLGYQTQSRMDIAYKPRESEDQELSDVLTKLAMFIVDDNQYPWVESQVFADGMIQQRGFFDLRMDFDENFNGDVRIETLDPMDVIPDPDSKSYDPDDWNDVMITKWMTLDDVKVTFGAAKWRKVMQEMEGSDDPDFGSDGFGEERNKFGDPFSYTSFYKDTSGEEHVRVIERQWWKLQNRQFWYDVVTGELTPIPDAMSKREKNQIAKANEWEVITKLTKRVRWTITTKDVVLHDDWSPYDHFTIVPFFPYFRRGKTRGLVDNLISTQNMLNKTYSQILHIVNTTANSGWTVEENSLANMETEELEDIGAQTGLVLEYKMGRTAPEKIQPNQIPTGLKDLVNTGIDLIRVISGVSETFQGGKGPEVSGTAIQSRVQQAAIQLASPIDNLFRTRNIVAQRLLKLIQAFYTEERVFLISKPTSGGEEEVEQVTINEENDIGEIINDVTVGKYDVVIADVPTQITFQNSQFQQALDMRKFGVNIPDDEMIMMSTLARKQEIAKKISTDPSPEQQEAAQIELDKLKGEVEKLLADSDKSKATAAKSAVDAAVLLQQNPGAAGIADKLLEGDIQPPTQPQLGELPPELSQIEGEF